MYRRCSGERWFYLFNAVPRRDRLINNFPRAPVPVSVPVFQFPRLHPQRTRETSLYIRSMRATKFKSLSDTGSLLTCYRQVGRLRDFPSENARGKLLLDGSSPSPRFLREGATYPAYIVRKVSSTISSRFSLSRRRHLSFFLSSFLFSSLYTLSIFRILEAISFDSRLNKNTER